MSKFRANAAAQHGRPANPLKALGALAPLVALAPLGPIKPSLELVDASSSNEIFDGEEQLCLKMRGMIQLRLRLEMVQIRGNRTGP
jgi:hypothetical protein